MTQNIDFLVVQFNPHVGAIAKNMQYILEVIKKNQSKFDVIIFPELALTGYPPEDLLFRTDFIEEAEQALCKIEQASEHCYVIVGHPFKESDKLYNCASILNQKKALVRYYKQYLPNYGVFDERRYFASGSWQNPTFTIRQQKIGICICEDLWSEQFQQQYFSNKADILISLNASPFDMKKQARRIEIAKKFAAQNIAVIYANLTGAQDELVFDGQSFAIDNSQRIKAQGASFAEEHLAITWSNKQFVGATAPAELELKQLYRALVTGVHDYIHKNRFQQGVIVGLSGGIDSALTLAIACDALGSDKVHAVLMPSRFTQPISFEDAMIQIKRLGVAYSELSIEPTFQALLTTLHSEFKNKAFDITEQNLQARIRCSLLMALSNHSGKLVLTTSNKSELAVGYSTLYGDLSGGFAVLKDVLKTQVYELAKFCNTESEIIPKRVIERPPSAELAENQTDQDNLPDYIVLDAIIEAFVEKNLSCQQIIALGIKPEIVKLVLRLIKRNEYKRRQAPVGVKVSTTAFGREWRYPITNAFDLANSTKIDNIKANSDEKDKL